MDNKLKNIIDEFYNNNNKKKYIGVTKQKQELAQKCIDNISFDTFINQCIIIEDNNILFSYYKIKPFLHPNIYNDILIFTLNKINNITNEYNNYNIIADIHSLTMSGIQRCYPLLLLFFENDTFINSLNTLTNIDLHNCPSCIKNIHAFLTPLFKKTNIVSKFRYF